MKKTKPNAEKLRIIDTVVLTLGAYIENNPDFFERIEKLADEHEKMRNTQNETFKNEFEAWRGFLAKEGFVLPKNEADFFDWLFYEKYPDEPISIETCRKIATITPDLFKEFSQYKAERHGFIKSKPIPPPAEPLPDFDEAISDKAKLPALWKALLEMKKPFLTSGGHVIGGKKARKHQQVMALAQVIASPLMGNRKQFEVYRMLCKRVGLDESSRPDKLPTKPGYDDIFREITRVTSDLRKVG